MSVPAKGIGDASSDAASRVPRDDHHHDHDDDDAALLARSCDSHAHLHDSATFDVRASHALNTARVALMSVTPDDMVRWRQPMRHHMS